MANAFLVKHAMIYGVAFDYNWVVKHIRVETANNLKQLYTSKYVQSDLGDIFKQIKSDLETGREVLFAGTPCQVAGLKSYLGKTTYDNLTTVDFICHGVPSPLVWEKYIDELEQKLKNKIIAISFRNKKDGWKDYNFAVKTSNGNSYFERPSENVYMQGFLKNLTLRPSCYCCNFKTLSRASDITLADFWGIDKVIPEMYDSKGVSLCWTSTKKGEKVLKSILLALSFKKVSLLEAVKHNECAIKSVAMHKNRAKFFEKLNNPDINIINLLEKCYDTRSFRKKLSHKIRSKLKSLFR